MKTIFGQYPSLIYRLALVVLLAEFAYIYIPLSSSVEFAPLWQSFSIKYLISAVAAVAAGWLASKAGDVRTGMMSAVAVLLLGYVIFNFSSPVVQVVGMVLVEGSVSALLVLCLLQAAVLFPSANDWKDHAFVLIFLATWLPTFLISFVFELFRYFEIEPWDSFFPAVMGLLALGLLYQFKDIGFRFVSEEEEEPAAPAERPRWQILAGLCLAAVVVQMASQYFTYLGRAETMLFYLGEWWIWTLVLGMAGLLAVVVFYQFRNAQAQPRQVEKVALCLAVLLGVFLLELLVRRNGAFELDFVGGFVAATVPLLLALPALVSILTHVQLDERTGLWLGIFLAAPHFALALGEAVMATGSVSIWVIPVTFAVLAVISLIFIWENKAFILKQLNLDEPNQEIEEPEEKGEDPIDHLVEK